MNKEYQHTQIGYLIIILFGALVLFTLIFISFYGFDFILISVLVIFVLCLSLFCTLTTIVKNNVLIVKFGVGVFRKEINLKEIDFCRVVKNPWYYGWGIRFTPDGLLLNVSGVHVVEIVMRSGKKYRIGTDEPDVLNKAISQSIKKKK